MRVRIVFTLKNKGVAVPFHHQSLLTGFIQTHLLNSAQQDYKFYNFSGLKGQTRVSRMGLHFYSSKVTLVVSSLSKSWIDTLLKAIFSHQEVEVGNLQLAPEYVELENAPTFQNQMKYVCISPVAIIDASSDNYQAKKFISPDEDAFSDLLYEAVIAQMQSTNLYQEADLASYYKFQVVPDAEYLKKIKDDEKKFARIYTIENGRNRAEFRGYTLPFTLYAHEAVQKFVFECGLGYHTHEGFGMIDTIHTENLKNTSVYTLDSFPSRV